MGEGTVALSRLECGVSFPFSYLYTSLHISVVEEPIDVIKYSWRL